MKLELLPDGFIIHNVTGIRTQIVQRLDGRGYDIRRCEHSVVRLQQNSYFYHSGSLCCQTWPHRLYQRLDDLPYTWRECESGSTRASSSRPASSAEGFFLKTWISGTVRAEYCWRPFHRCGYYWLHGALWVRHIVFKCFE